VSGAYGALSDTLFFAGNTVLGPSLVPQGQVNLQTGASSGLTLLNGNGLVTSVPANARSGVAQQFSLNDLTSIAPVRTSEAPANAASMTHTPVGQTGQTILPFTRTMAALTNGNTIIQLSTSGFMALPTNFNSVTVKPPVISAVTNAADGTAAVAPGGLVNIWGSGLSAAGNAPGAAAACLYSGASSPIPLLYTSDGQINAQLPFDAPASMTLVLSNANGASAPFTFPVLPNAPAIFRSSGLPQIIRTVDGKQITDATPIHLNEVLHIFVTGLGAVTGGAVAGIPAPATPQMVTLTAPQVYIGGTQLFTLWSGLVPGTTGVYEIDVQVPFHSIPTGPKIPLTIRQGAYQTQVQVPVSE
jgi:uncharacterized protein (TIGR03437 family)